MSTSRSTFTSWLKEQEYRADATGQLAQFWRDHTPGRISAVAGVQKHLTALVRQPGQIAVDAGCALDALDGAVREYEAARSGRPPLAAVPDIQIEPCPAQDPHNAHGFEDGGMAYACPGRQPSVTGRIDLADGTYVFTGATPWQHVLLDATAHPAGQCEACMPAVRAVVPDQPYTGDPLGHPAYKQIVADGPAGFPSLFGAEHAGDGTVPAAAADAVLSGSRAASGPPSPVRDAVSRATAAGVRAAQAHGVRDLQHERDPDPLLSVTEALARIESKLDRVLALLGLDDESMAGNIRAEIDPQYPDVSGGGVPYPGAGPNRADDEGREPPPGWDKLTTSLDREFAEPAPDDFARLYELADFGEEG